MNKKNKLSQSSARVTQNMLDLLSVFVSGVFVYWKYLNYLDTPYYMPHISYWWTPIVAGVAIAVIVQLVIKDFCKFGHSIFISTGISTFVVIMGLVFSVEGVVGGLSGLNDLWLDPTWRSSIHGFLFAAMFMSTMIAGNCVYLVISYGPGFLAINYIVARIRQFLLD